ncbi:hypothetical protein AMTR_s00076p00157360 [Amborella trichopoda]|uniref:Uncharacterized protein n=1 Tax=Amborella trichopoda TaxID=13333 RepID=W1P4A6_AMBTC|nr:hypothetical protein AMTR_s00076p00157360 [Amborella trichopoda]
MARVLKQYFWSFKGGSYDGGVLVCSNQPFSNPTTYCLAEGFGNSYPCLDQGSFWSCSSDLCQVVGNHLVQLSRMNKDRTLFLTLDHLLLLYRPLHPETTRTLVCPGFSGPRKRM